MQILKTITYDISNGPGVRLSIWTAGCSHHCKGCWSPNTWNPKKGKPLKEVINKIEEELQNPNIDGVSILGGDPLYNTMKLKDNSDLDNLLNLCLLYKKPVWLWTGYKYEEIPDQVKLKCEVIIDGKFEEDKKDLDLYYRGSSNQRVIKVNSDVNKIEELKLPENL